MLDLHKYLTSIGPMIDVSDNQQEDAWNCGMYTLRNLRTLIECLNKGGEPSFGILKPAAEESAFFRNLRKQSAWEMQQLITEHNDNLASILSYIPPPPPSATKTPLQRGPPPSSQIPPCRRAVIGCNSQKTARFVFAITQQRICKHKRLRSWLIIPKIVE
ncbi:unnamed protein product [Trichogramma brassicae]|uniref:Uncharacterized protein n=1 Tax=Trichogramma brassicae TaxID=86971 RepID=A0A6H5IAT7_9HYME|nr:unnamed protein product [Trichogramma brassicae]